MLTSPSAAIYVSLSTSSTISAIKSYLVERICDQIEIVKHHSDQHLPGPSRFSSRTDQIACPFCGATGRGASRQFDQGDKTFVHAPEPATTAIRAYQKQK
jgi:hypothetical protein